MFFAVYNAGMAELADALASGASPRKGVWVQVPLPAPEGANLNTGKRILHFVKKVVAVVVKFKR